MRQLNLGGVQIDKFGDGPDTPFALSRLLPHADPELLNELAAIYGAPHLEADGRTLRLAMHSFLVRTKHHTIMVDTCLGNDKERPGRDYFHHRQTPYLDNLKALGVAPEDIDFVLCTHMHSDHVGWNTRLDNGRWVPTFPKARYVMARKEYDHWAALAQDGRVKELHGSFEDSVLPVVETNQAMFWDQDDHICEHVRFEYFIGHSPGNVAIHLAGSAGEAICSGDIVHSPVQFRYPDLLTSCPDAEAARQSRLRLYDQIVDTSKILLPAHFQSPSAGLLRSAQVGMHYEFVN